MKTLSFRDKCYIAGFVDGEGCLHIFKRWHKNNQYSKSYKYIGYSIAVGIGGTNKQVLEYIKEKCGVGSIYECKKKNEKWMQTWGYRICGKEAQELIRAIYPYLIVKKVIADIFLKFPCPNRGIKYYQLELKEKLYIQARNINSPNSKILRDYTPTLFREDDIVQTV